MEHQCRSQEDLSSNLTLDILHSLAVWPWASHLTPIASSWVISSHLDEYLVTGFRSLWKRSEGGDLHSPPSLKTKSSTSHVIISLMAWSSSATKDKHTEDTINKKKDNLCPQWAYNLQKERRHTKGVRKVKGEWGTRGHLVWGHFVLWSWKQARQQMQSRMILEFSFWPL